MTRGYLKRKNFLICMGLNSLSSLPGSYPLTIRWTHQITARVKLWLHTCNTAAIICSAWVQYISITVYICSDRNSSAGTVRYAISNNISMIDMDRSYHVKKYKQLRQVRVNVVPLGRPSLPQSGWIAINEAKLYGWVTKHSKSVATHYSTP